MNATAPSHKNHLLRLLGAGLTAFSIASFIFHYGPLYRQNYQLKIQNEWLNPVQAATPSSSFLTLSDSTTGAVIEEAASWEVNSSFSIVIPKLNARAAIIANVNPFDPTQYHLALQEGIAHAKGTSFPGYPGTTYLFAHSTDSALNVSRYNAVFYRLGDLEMGDNIIIFFQDQKFFYQVTDKLIISAKDTSWLARDTETRLILQTCDPPGTTFRRLLVIARPLVDI